MYIDWEKPNLPCYLVPPAAGQQRATIWFHFNWSLAIVGSWYKFILPLRRSSFTVAHQIFFGQVWGRQRMWPVNWMCLFATILLRFVDSVRLSTSSFVILSLQDIFKILKRQLKWDTSRIFAILLVTFHVSYAYEAVERTVKL